MPAVSKKQQKFFGIVRAIQKGEMAPTTPETAKAAADMKKGDVKKFASTKHKGLPEKKKIVEDKQVKKIIKQLRKSVKSHKKQADTLEKKIKTFKESAFTNITVGNKIGQTFQHATGATITLDNTMSDPSDLPSQVTLDLGFGDTITVDAPSTNEYGIAGITSSLGNAGGGGGVQTRQRTKTAAEINLQLDASQQASGAETAKVGEITDPLKFSNQIQAADAAYTQRQAKIQALNDEKGKVYDRYRSQYDVLNNKMQKIIDRYTRDSFTVDPQAYEDPEYKALLKQMGDLSDAEKAEIDRLDAVTAIPSPSDYQLPGTKEYKDMQRVSFDEWIKTVNPFAYGSKDNFLINDPEKRWTYMRDWAAQNKPAMNTSRVQALKDLPDPATGKPYDLRRLVGADADTELGEYVREKLKNIGQIHFDHNELGGSIKHSDLEFMVLTKGAPALDVYVQELNVFEKHMKGVNKILDKDLKEVVKKLKKEWKSPSEIQRRTQKQAENLKYYQNYLEQIKNFKGNISRIIPAIQNAFAGNFEPTPTPIKPPKPPAGFNYMDDMPPGEGTFDADGNYIPPGFEDAIRTDQIYDADEVSPHLKDGFIENLLRSVANKVNVGTAKEIYDYHLRFLNNPTTRIQDVSKLVKKKDLKVLMKLLNSHDIKKLKFAPKAIYGELQKAINDTPGLANGIGNLDQANLYIRGNYYYIEKPYDFSNILDTIGKKGFNAPAYALLQTLRGKMKPQDFLLGTKTMNMRIKIPIGANVNESKLSFELIQQFKEGSNPDRPKKLKEQTTFAQMQQRIRDAKEKRREQQKKSEKLYMDTKKKGVKFYDKKGTGRLKDGKKIYD